MSSLYHNLQVPVTLDLLIEGYSQSYTIQTKYGQEKQQRIETYDWQKTERGEENYSMLYSVMSSRMQKSRHYLETNLHLAISKWLLFKFP